MNARRMGRAVGGLGLGLTLLVLALPFADARADLCASQLAELGAYQPSADTLPAAWSVPLGRLLPFLATVEGVKDLSPASFGNGPPGSGQRRGAADPNYPVAATCSGPLLFFTKNAGNYLVTVDVRAETKLSGVGGLFGGPVRAWRVTDTVYALNLYASNTNLEALILDVWSGDILFYEGPFRFGDLKVALVVPGRGVLLENTSWGFPSAWGRVDLLLYDVTKGSVRRRFAELPSCSFKLPPNAYTWRVGLEPRGLVLQAKVPPRGPTTPPYNPKAAPIRSVRGSAFRAGGTVSRTLKPCHAVAERLLGN